MIDRETQQRIKDAAKIVDVVGDYVKLTRRGANYMGLCPFHNERTPSFSVSPSRNFCHCFSCKKGGSPVNFIMEKEGVGYTEALLMLAKKYGIPVQERELSDEEKARMSQREALLVANEWAMNRFHHNLFNTEEGRDIGLSYLYDRGITDEAIRKYKIGYSIDRGDALLSEARKEGFDIEILKQLGLIGTSQQGRDYDRFRGRVMFPIRNASGKTVAFGGRALKGEAAKYINSPETMLYKKSNELYGIFVAKPEIIRRERVFLMEGYLDVVGSWQAGLRNAVASSGTALTENQIALIHRFTDNVTLIYDGDEAGIKASLRGIDMLLAQKLHVKVLLLPEGEDPDSFARKHTPEEFQQYIDSHQTDFIHYKLSVLLRNAAGNPQAVSEAVRSVVGSIAAVPDEIERITYIKECARMVDIDEKVIARQVVQALLSGNPGPSFSHSPRPVSSHTSSPVDNTPANTDSSSGDTPGNSESLPFRNQEEVILKYCVRYGYLPVEGPGKESPMVVDFVAEEMEADGIDFSVDAFNKVFNLIRSGRETFLSRLKEFEEELELLLQSQRSEFQESLRVSGGSLARIKAEEEKFEASENERRYAELKKFTIAYLIDFLTNHEDGEVRVLVNPLVAERHILSSIYAKAGGDVTAEEDRLSVFVPRALAELRSEILSVRYRDLQKRLALALEDGDPELRTNLMNQLNKVIFLRKRIAENLGERILSPR